MRLILFVWQHIYVRWLPISLNLLNVSLDGLLMIELGLDSNSSYTEPLVSIVVAEITSLAPLACYDWCHSSTSIFEKPMTAGPCPHEPVQQQLEIHSSEDLYGLFEKSGKNRKSKQGILYLQLISRTYLALVY